MTFEFNQYGICTNPEYVTIYKSNRDSATVNLAQTEDGKWCYGYSWNCLQGGSSCTAGKGEYRKLYDSRFDALLASIDQGISWSKYYETWPDPHPEHHKRFTKALETYKASLFQLTLF